MSTIFYSLKRIFILIAMVAIFSGKCAWCLDGITDARRTILPRRDSSIWSPPEAHPVVQFGSSVELMMETAFQNTEALQEMGVARFSAVTRQQELLFRRLLLLIGMGGLMYRGENAQNYEPWPFPLASSLTQGQRIFIELNGISSEAFLAWLTGGNMGLLPQRKYSSHGVRVVSGQLQEVKIKSPFRRLNRNERMYGMNFPLGGVGNELPNGSLVGPFGFEYSLGKSRLSRKKQLGHLHIYTHDFPDRRQSVVLIGIESCGPGTNNQFGCSHTAMSAIRNQRLNRSTSGGLKWARMHSLESSPPAEYKGKVLYLTQGKFDLIQRRVTFILSKTLDEQKKLYSIFLRRTGERCKNFLMSYGVWARS